jgi:phosphoglucosamine mutase
VRKLFGTDGIRGAANAEPMTAATMMKVAVAAGRHFTRGDHRHRVIIGKDTRLSGYLIEPALTAGFISVGMDVILTGPMPTPAVAMLTRTLRADLGVVISASHNPYADNGVKFFGPDGFKLSDEIEAEIERNIDSSPPLAGSDRLGRARRLDDAEGRYIEFVKGTFPRGLRLDGLKIVVDCANGAAYRMAPAVLWELGAEVVTVGVEPDGYNINAGCGATHPETLQTQVVAHNADLGIALDGDADRVQLVDEKGYLIDGDQVMGVIARSWRDTGRLSSDRIVATVMSNLGLEKFLASLKIGMARAPVGDRHVLEMMRAQGCNVGGEQSGHIILTDYSTTGDGLIAALQVLACIVAANKPASEVLRVFTAFPQVLKNVRLSGSIPALDTDPVRAAITVAETRLGAGGRLLVRKSGTEPLIRVMAEGEDEVLVGTVVDDLAAIITRAAG